MGDTIETGSPKFISVRYKYIFGALVVLFAIIIAFICVCVQHKYEIKEMISECDERVKEMLKDFKVEKFEQNTVVTQTQPLVYNQNIKIAPGNCKPYSGCFFPATAANPVNPRTGKRKSAKDADMVWCEESWRDCNAYQTCKNGKCVTKL